MNGNENMSLGSIQDYTVENLSQHILDSKPRVFPSESQKLGFSIGGNPRVLTINKPRDLAETSPTGGHSRI